MAWEGGTIGGGLSDPLEIAKGNVLGTFSVAKFGRNDAVGTGGEDIWANGGTYPWPEAAETIRVKAGGNTNDDASGTGARSVTVEGLDENWMRASETLTTAGTSASSASTTTFTRIFRAYVEDVGTYGVNNTGDIVIEGVTSSDELANITAGEGQTQMAMYTVPAGYTAYLRRVSIVIESNRNADVTLFQRRNADDITAPMKGKRMVRGFTNINDERAFTFTSLPSFPEKTDLWFFGQTNSGNSSVTCAMDLVMVAS